MKPYGRPREAWQPFDSVLNPAFTDLFFSMMLSVLSESMLHALKRKQKLKSCLVLLLWPRQTKTLCKENFHSIVTTEENKERRTKDWKRSWKPKIFPCHGFPSHFTWSLCISVQLSSLLHANLCFASCNEETLTKHRNHSYNYLVLSHRQHGHSENRSGVVMHLLASLW